MQLSDKVDCLSKELHRLDPGPLAELRRMSVYGPGTAAYWHLAGRCAFLTGPADRWMRIVKIMAILTPRGEPGGRPPLHDPKRSLGGVLCDGGVRGWPDSESRKPHPFVSEARFARLLAQRPEQRPETLERLARMLARQRDPQMGVDCVDIAALVLGTGGAASLQRLARRYYQCLDRATRKSTQQETAA